MDPRQLLRSSKTIAAGAGASAALATVGLANTRTPHAPATMQRFSYQHWALDHISQANGTNSAQRGTKPRPRGCGMEIMGDITNLRRQGRKYADIVPAFVALAQGRERRANEHEKAGERIPARDNYYIAA